MAPPSASRAMAATCVRRAKTMGAHISARRHSAFAATVATPRFATTTSLHSDVLGQDGGAQNYSGHPLASFSSSARDEQAPELPPVLDLIENVRKAFEFNQGNPVSKKHHSLRRARQQYFWDYEFCRTTADAYEKYLLGMADKSLAKLSKEDREELLKPQVVEKAFTVLLKCKLQPTKLSARVRDWEKALGTLAATPLTERLSLKLVQANGKTGNIGRVLSLLEYRTQQEFKPQRVEFIHAVTAIEAASWYLRTQRNIFLGEKQQPVLDNPTRWLDAILLNMSKRNVPLDVRMAVRMLDTFASQGRTGKAVHYFYSVEKIYLDVPEEEDENKSENRIPMENNEKGIEEEITDDPLEFNEAVLPSEQERPYKVRLKLKSPPPFYKIPTEMQGKLLYHVPKNKETDGRQERPQGVLKLDRESDPDWSVPLTAAFSFADSLTLGACGHEPIKLNLICYNVLIKTCVYRGALWRAMHLIDTVMPAAGIAPNGRSYDTLLAGLARVGDVTMIRNYYQQMLSKGIAPSYYTVQCIVEGLLNLGDVASAITLIQDFFNQHNVLPPVTTQLKILEFALGLDMVYEAKRHVYFIQQLWKWEPHYQYESKKFIYLMKTYQQDPRISKEALKHLFKYFGEELNESDFF